MTLLIQKYEIPYYILQTESEANDNGRTCGGELEAVKAGFLDVVNLPRLLPSTVTVSCSIRDSFGSHGSPHSFSFHGLLVSSGFSTP